MRIWGTLLLLAIISTPAAGAVPGSIDYQGFLSNADGSPVDGTLIVTFSIYNTDIGGAPLWSDAQVVSFDQGLFSVELGGLAAPFPPGLFGNPLYLGVDVNSDGEMLPRRPLRSVAYAFEAADSDTLQGQGPAAFDQGAHVTDMSNPHGVTAAQTGAASEADIVSLQMQLESIALDVAQLQTDLVNEVSARIADVDAEEAARIADVSDEANARIAQDNIHSAAIASAAARLDNLEDPVAYQIVLGPAAFDARDTSEDILKERGTGGAYHTGPSAFGDLVAPLTLIDGAVITGMTAFFEDNSAAEDLRVNILRQRLNSSYELVGPSVSSTGISGYGSDFTALFHVVDLSNYSYLVRVVDANDFNLRIKGVRIDYSITPE